MTLRKWIVLAVLIALPLTIFLVNDENKLCDKRIRETSHVFLVSAFQEELDALLEIMDRTETCTYEGITYHIGDFNDENLVIFMTGVGPKLSKLSTVSTLRNFDIELLVFSGTAGGVDPGLSIGQTVVVKEWHDLTTGSSVGISEELITSVEVLQDVHIAEQGVTADYFVTDTSTLPEDMAIVDMETYGVASTAQVNDVPFIAFRTVSDLADGSKSESAIQAAAEKSADLSLQFVTIYKDSDLQLFFSPR